MMIALNMATLRGFGSAQVGRSLLTSLAELKGPHTFRAWIPRAWRIAPPSVNVELCQVSAGLYQKIITDQVRLREGLRLDHFDRLFSLTDTSIVWNRIPHLLLVHQAHLIVPAKELSFLNSRERVRYALMRSYFRAGMPSVTMFTVQTQFMKQGLQEMWGIPDRRIVVIPSAIETLNSSSTRWNATPKDPPYVFYPAGPWPHKNHEVFVDLLATARARGRHVVAKLTVDRKSMPDLYSRAVAAGVSQQIEFIGAKTTREVRHLLANATAAVIPSKLESYGLTYLEAMYVGAPVVTADRPFAREACGDAAVFCSVDDGREFGEAVCQLLDNPGMAQRLSDAGKRRFAAVGASWTEVRDAYIDVLLSLEG